MIDGRKLQALREAHGYSRARLAALCDVSPATVQRWEKENSLTNITYIDHLAALYDMTREQLLGEEKPAPPQPWRKRHPVLFTGLISLAVMALLYAALGISYACRLFTLPEWMHNNIADLIWFIIGMCGAFYIGTVLPMTVCAAVLVFRGRKKPKE